MRTQRRRFVASPTRLCPLWRRPKRPLRECVDQVNPREVQMPDTGVLASRELRRALGAFVTGVTVITTTDGEGRFHGVTANSFSSVSLDPPLVLWSQAVKTQSHSTFFEAERFAVTILADDQIELSNRFAKASQEKCACLELDGRVGG